MSFWLSLLSLPEDLLERLRKASGHRVPEDVVELVTHLQKSRQSLGSECEALREDYESYVQFCKSVSVEPEDIQPKPSKHDSTRSWALIGAYDRSKSDDVLRGIPITFSSIERLRSLERSLRDLDGLIDFLSRIVERVAGVTKKTGEEVRIFITSTGKGLQFQMVYELTEATTPKPGREQARDQSSQARQIGPVDVQRWIDYGLKALSEKSPKTDPTYQTTPAE